jgi:hypothetical protein
MTKPKVSITYNLERGITKYTLTGADADGSFSWEKPITLEDDEARALADAIYNELGLGWKPYPENTPEGVDKYYDTTVTNDVARWVEKSYYFNGVFGFIETYNFVPYKNIRVIAYRERPKPYQPESEE